MAFFYGLLVGLLVGLIGVPLGFYIFSRVKETKVRREIKLMLMNNKFLSPIDPKDFDTEMWKDKIDTSNSKNEIGELNDRIFKIGKFSKNKI